AIKAAEVINIALRMVFSLQGPTPTTVALIASRIKCANAPRDAERIDNSPRNKPGRAICAVTPLTPLSADRAQGRERLPLQLQTAARSPIIPSGWTTGRHT